MDQPEDAVRSERHDEDGPPAVSRRGFLQTASAAIMIGGLGRLTPAYARRLVSRASSVVDSAARPTPTSIELAIREAGVRIGDRVATATTINGTLPGPLLRLREGTDAIIRVSNALREDTSIHWHGVLVPNPMDGVPGVNFPGIPAGETFTYRFPVRQYGTYWYHSHSGLQEQTGVYGPLIIDPADPEPFQYEREFVVVLSDWSFESPYKILDNIKKKADYYQYQRRTIGDFFRDVDQAGWRAAIADRREWAKMRMSPIDLSDVTGATYRYLINGQPAESNWTGLFRPGERVRLRFINAGAGTNFDVRIPGLEMIVVQVNGQYVQPVTTDEFRIAIAETYDVIVRPAGDQAYTLFAESSDRSGYTRGTLASRPGMTAPVPARRPRPLLSMSDMGMSMTAMGGMEGMSSEDASLPSQRPTSLPGASVGAGGVNSMGGMTMGRTAGSGSMRGMNVPAGSPSTDSMPGMTMPAARATTHATANDFRAPGTVPETVAHGPDKHGSGNASTPMETRSRVAEPGNGLGGDGWRVLTYADLRALHPRADALRPPVREIEFHLTGNMERYMWSIDGRKFSESPEPIHVTHGERLRMTLVNDTMMEHPMHLHGMWMELENGTLGDLPRMHTINVKPAERVSVLVTPDEAGPWAFHCHVLFHMEMGMFRVVQVADAPASAAVRE